MYQTAFQPDAFQNSAFQIDVPQDKVDEGKARLNAKLSPTPVGGSAQVKLPSG